MAKDKQSRQPGPLRKWPHASHRFKGKGGSPHVEKRSNPDKPKVPAGYDVRALAVRLVSAVLDRHRALDDALGAEFASGPGASLEPRDKGLARLIATTVLRRKGELEAVVAAFIEKPLPADRGLLTPILLCAAAQLLILDIAPHAVINIAVEQCRHDRGARRFDRLANAVLRRISERGREIMATLPGNRVNIPEWMWTRWTSAYGETGAQLIADASLREAPLDLTMKRQAEASQWAERLGGVLLATGCIRLASVEARIEALPGFAEGAWWVQDAAAALPVRLLGDVRGQRVADICSAPGGKTLQLAAAGAHVTAIDISAERLARVDQNLARLGLAAETVAADALTWRSTSRKPFDAVLLDAPCTATGTIRRHPDILHLKRPADLGALSAIQQHLLERAIEMAGPGALIVYCTCSLEPEEGERQVERLLARNQDLERLPIDAAEAGLDPAWITPAGDLRTLPHHLPNADPRLAGMDGFYAARLRRLPEVGAEAHSR